MFSFNLRGGFFHENIKKDAFQNNGGVGEYTGGLIPPRPINVTVSAGFCWEDIVDTRCLCLYCAVFQKV